MSGSPKRESRRMGGTIYTERAAFATPRSYYGRDDVDMFGVAPSALRPQEEACKANRPVAEGCAEPRCGFLGFALIAVAAAVADGWKAFGRAAEGDRLARMQRSPQWKDGHFVNPQPLANDYWRMFTGLLEASRHTSPDGAAAHGRRRSRAFQDAAADRPARDLARSRRAPGRDRRVPHPHRSGVEPARLPVRLDRTAALVHAADRTHRPASHRRRGDLARSLRSPRLPDDRPR